VLSHHDLTLSSSANATAVAVRGGDRGIDDSCPRSGRLGHVVTWQPKSQRT